MQQQSLEKKILSSVPTIYLLGLFLLPIIIMIIMSFRIPDEYAGALPLINVSNKSIHINTSLDSFKFILNSPFIWTLCLRSLKYSIITTVLCLILGYPLALLIVRSSKKIRDLLLLLVIVPFWSCFLIRIYAWMIILSPQSVISYYINHILKIFGFMPVNLLYSSFAVILCLVYINLPFMILPVYANLEKHDNAMIEASRDLGANAIQSFLQITIPLSMPGILAGSALVFIPSIGMFVVSELVGNNCALMIGNLIKQQFLQTMNWPLGSAIAITMTLVVLSVSGFVALLAKKYGGLKYANA